MQSGLRFRPSDGALIGFVTATPFEVSNLASRGAELTPPSESAPDAKTKHGIIASQNEQLIERLASMARVFVLCSLDGTMVIAVSVQFVRDDGVGKSYDMATCQLQIIAELASIGVHVHMVLADNHVTNTVSGLSNFFRSASLQ